MAAWSTQYTGQLGSKSRSIMTMVRTGEEVCQLHRVVCLTASVLSGPWTVDSKPHILLHSCTVAILHAIEFSMQATLSTRRRCINKIHTSWTCTFELSELSRDSKRSINLV